MENKKSTFWGIFLLVAAAFIIAGNLGVFGDISVWTVGFSVVLAAWFITSLFKLSFGGMLFSLAFAAILFDEALGIEAISRGARKVYFVDNNRQVKPVLEKNLRNIKEPFEILIEDYERAINIFSKKGIIFDIVLIDAPYKSDFGEKALELLAEKQLLNEGATIVYEQERLNCLQNVGKCYKIVKTKTHGIANISILEYTRE